ncbi:unnamed protein product [Psylliodes chrysocephalus]|uniref:DDE Tnp4 domain-containing protein n=1 Tax=Psylliodes chrysocephalus TaxID=3402493 RepID=A0A9P0GAF2_9CUCU|nr:unnamed protein product [Psylliodes chrysocephala]
MQIDINNLRGWVNEGNIFVVDRGYRDAVEFLKNLGFCCDIPPNLPRGQRQFTVEEANRARLITKTRWIVESRNDHLKNILKFFKNTIQLDHCVHLKDLLKIGCAPINRYHQTLTIPDATPELSRRLVQIAAENYSRVQARVKCDNLFVEGECEKQLPEVKIIRDDIKKSSERSVQTDTIRKQTCTCKNLPSSFDVPKPNTLVKLCKQINCFDAEEKTRKDKKLASDEKVLKNLNFPYDKPIYKDLIPLMCEKNQSPPTSVRSPLPQKDKEPVLSDFLELKRFPDYFVLHSTEIEDKMSQSKNNNLRLYKILDINS